MDEYEKHQILSKCSDVVLEAKRVLLNVELEKIANITLSELHNSRKIINESTMKCKESLDLNSDLFWAHLPNPKNPRQVNGLNEVKAPPTQQQICHDVGLIKLMQIDTKSVDVLKNYGGNSSKKLLKKYFCHWKQAVGHKKNLLEKIDHQEKLDRFIKQVKRRKKQECSTSAKDSRPDKKAAVASVSSTGSTLYKNRFDAQKSIIDMQKRKMADQNKIIEELKLGIIREDLLKSMDNSRVDIREIFSTCSETLKLKVPHLELTDDRDKFKINTQKAPKIVQKMEQRALEREQNRQIILERKRIIEENRRRLLEEALENKRVLEEEEKKRNLVMIKERRQKELEIEKIRQENKQKYLENLNKSYSFYRKLLLEQSFRKLLNYYHFSKENYSLAVLHCESRMKQKTFNCWCAFIENKWTIKYNRADSMYYYKTLRRTLKVWYDVYFERVRSMQVAEDVYDLRLTSNTFLKWHRQVCKIVILREKRWSIAEKHYKRRILFHYFYQWRSLPAVIQLEKAKDLKKRKWREKVWEILPDYQAPDDTL